MKQRKPNDEKKSVNTSAKNWRNGFKDCIELVIALN